MHRAQYVPSQRMKVHPNQAQWWHRFCEHGLTSGREIVIKMDPDALLHRKFETFPSEDIFGTVTCLGPVQGGVKGFKRNTLAKMYGGECLKEEYNTKPVFLKTC
jgi:hypothetical protein